MENPIQSVQTGQEPKKGMAVASLVLGIGGILPILGLLLAPVGIILGIVATVKGKKEGGKITIPVAGIISGAVLGLGQIPVTLITIAILVPLLVAAPLLDNHITASNCSAAIAEARAAHSFVTAQVVDEIARGNANLITNTTITEYSGSVGNSNQHGHGVANVTVTVRPAAGGDYFIEAVHRDGSISHAYDSSWRTTGCGRDNCPAN
jgi:hypothetical protein